MTVFDDREKAFETKFKLDEESQFKVNARAVHKFGLWAAAELGLEGADAEAYSQQVMDADFDMPGTADFIKKVQDDLAGKGIEMTVHHLENQYHLLRDQAAEELFAVG